MIIYWSLFLILATGALLHQDRGPGVRWTFIALASIPTALMIALRWQIGPDWAAYGLIFDYTKLFDFSQSVTHSDPGFFVILWTLHRLGEPYWVLNAVCGTVFVAGLTTFCSRQPNPWLAYLLAFPYLLIVIGMSGDRQSLALGFLFFALCAFERHHPARFAVLTLLASLFHASVILMLPIGILSFTHKGPFRVLLLIACSVIGYYLVHSAFGVYATRYSLDRLQSSGIWYRLAMNGLPAAIFLGFQWRFPLSEHQRILWRNVSLLSLGAVPLIFVVPSSTAIDRLILYFFPLQFVVLSHLPYVISSERRMLASVVLIVIAYAATIQFVFLNFAKFADYYVPYLSILQNGA